MPRQCFMRKRINRIAPASSSLISSFHTISSYRAAEAIAPESGEMAEEVPEDGLITRFASLGSQGLINQKIINTITGPMALETMTPVQSQTISEALQGVDTLGLARTGTGKTVAFLLPVIQRILKRKPELEIRGRKSEINIQSIIISPTRELAEQIAKEARRIVGGTGIEIGLAVGGTGRSAALRDMQRYGCHILVGTPGRLHDLLSDRSSGVAASALNTFVLDEADRLLDDGFGPAIEKIYQLLPGKMEVDRQTFMFSATMEPEVMRLVSRFMKPDFRTVRTVAEGETQTHDRVPQFGVITNGLENNVPTLFELFKRESMATENFKAIVFFNTSAEASLTTSIYERSSLSKKIDIQGLVMHARLTQGARTRTSNNFRRAEKAIMFSSDVAARGMDFPNVTHVIQMGVPKDRDTYIHRIGRTGRAGKEGQGWLLLSEWDIEGYVKKLRNLPITEDKSLACAELDMREKLSIPAATAEILTDVIQSAKAVDFESKSAAYRSFMSLGTSVDKATLVNAINRWAKYGWGMDQPPAISPLLAQKLGFRRVEGLNIGSDARARPPPSSDYNDDGPRRRFDRPDSRSGGRQFAGRSYENRDTGRSRRDGRGFGGGGGDFGGDRRRRQVEY